MNLFQLGDFTSHAGNQLAWKIECDALTDDDWECLAKIISDRYSFNAVYGIPRGGNKLAQALEKYCNPEAEKRIVVDDVYTTGKSMNAFLGHNDFGVVVFARQQIPSNVPVYALFAMS